MSEGIKSYEIKSKMFVDPKLQSIFEETEGVFGQSIKKIVDLREENVRRCLIALGWTPPERETSFWLQETPEERLSACVNACMEVPTSALRKCLVKDMIRRGLN